MSRLVTLTTEATRERPMLARALVCAQLAQGAKSPRATVVVLMASFLNAKAQPRGGRELTPIRIVDELEARGHVRVVEWPEVEVLTDPNWAVEEPAVLEWLDSVLRCAELMRKVAA